MSDGNSEYGYNPYGQEEPQKRSFFDRFKRNRSSDVEKSGQSYDYKQRVGCLGRILGLKSPQEKADPYSSPTEIQRYMENYKQVESAANLYNQEVQSAETEAEAALMGLGTEAKVFAESILPGLLNTARPKNLGAGALELVPIPGIWIWSPGDVIGLIRGVASAKAGKPVEATLKIISAAIPGLPTAPAHAFINEWMERRAKTSAKLNQSGGGNYDS